MAFPECLAGTIRELRIERIFTRTDFDFAYGQATVET